MSAAEGFVLFDAGLESFTADLASFAAGFVSFAAGLGSFGAGLVSFEVGYSIWAKCILSGVSFMVECLVSYFMGSYFLVSYFFWSFFLISVALGLASSFFCSYLETSFF